MHERAKLELTALRDEAMKPRRANKVSIGLDLTEYVHSSTTRCFIPFKLNFSELL